VATIHIQDQYHILETSRSIPGEQRNEFLREVARRLKQWRFPTSQQVDQFDLMSGAPRFQNHSIPGLIYCTSTEKSGTSWGQ
jgi:hypothetical protein